jgi:hypothetical protein
MISTIMPMAMDNAIHEFVKYKFQRIIHYINRSKIFSFTLFDTEVKFAVYGNYAAWLRSAVDKS